MGNLRDDAIEAFREEQRRAAQQPGHPLYPLAHTTTIAIDHADRIVDFILDALDLDKHIIEFDEAGWSLQHPIACRPDLLVCPVSLAAAGESAEGVRRPHGRYVIALVGETALQYEPVS